MSAEASVKKETHPRTITALGSGRWVLGCSLTRPSEHKTGADCQQKEHQKPTKMRANRVESREPREPAARTGRGRSFVLDPNADERPFANLPASFAGLWQKPSVSELRTEAAWRTPGTDS